MLRWRCSLVVNSGLFRHTSLLLGLDRKMPSKKKYELCSLESTIADLQPLGISRFEKYAARQRLSASAYTEVDGVKLQGH